MGREDLSVEARLARLIILDPADAPAEARALVIQPQGRLFDLKPKPTTSCPPSSKSNT